MHYHKRLWLIAIFFIFLTFNWAQAIEFNVATINAWTIPIVSKKALKRTKYISRHLHSYDFVGMQEIWLPWHRYIVRRNGPDGFYNIFQKKPLWRDLLGSGLFNLSKYQMIDSRYWSYTSCAEIDCWSDKGNPTILMGDMNINAYSQHYSKMMRKLVGFQDAWEYIHPHLPGYTVHPHNTWKKSTATPRRIDYIFFKQGSSTKLWPISAEVIFDQQMPNGNHPSDHFGVTATFQID